MAVRIIQVGVGGFGRGWVDVVAASRQCRHAALVDVNPQALQVARERTGVPQDRTFSDLSRALKEVEADAVLIVTPPRFHRGQALMALKSGLHVLTEKPLSDSMRSAREMVEAAKSARRVLMVSQNYRFRRAARTVRALIESGKLGEVGYVSIGFHKAPKFAGSFRLKMQYPLLVDMSIHHFDLLRYISGQDAVRVHAKSFRPRWSWFEHEPAVAATFEMTKGVVAGYFGSWVSEGRETTWDGDWRIQCSKGAVLWRDGEVVAALAGKDTQVPLVRMRQEDLHAALAEFAAAVEQGRQPETSGLDNLRSLAMVFACLRSARLGRPVRV